MNRNGFCISPRDHVVMTAALKTAGLDESMAKEVLEALLEQRHMLIDSSLYSDLYVGANIYGLPS